MLAVAAGAWSAPAARAGSYTWTVCAGSTAVGSAAAGDHVAVYGPAGTYALACAFNNQSTESERRSEGYAGFTTVTAPSSTSITAVRFDGYGNNYSLNSSWGYRVSTSSTVWSCSYYENGFPGTTCDSRGNGGFDTHGAQVLNTSTAGDPFVQVGIYCRAAAGCGVGTLDLAARGLRFDIRDDTDPVVTPSGPAWIRGTLTGAQPLAYSAIDNAAGTRGITVSIDDTTVADTRQGPDGAGCDPAAWHRCPDDSGTVSIPLDAIADGPHTMSVLTFDDVGNTSTPRTRSVTVDNVPPVLTGPTQLTGSARVGEQLTCVSPAVDGQTPKVEYSWARANPDGSARTAIDGATRSTYVLTAADQNRKVTCTVSASDAGGTASRESSLTAGPFANGATVQASASGGDRDPSGDFDGDAIPNDQDPDDDNDGTPDASDPSPYDASVPARTGERTGTKTTTSPGSASAPAPATSPATSQPGGTNTSHGARLTAAFVHHRGTKGLSRYGTTATLHGRLTASDGAAIRGVTIEALVNSAGRARPVSSTRTDPDGRFTLKLTSRSGSRSLLIRYRPDPAQVAVSAQLTVELRVKATLTLHAAATHGGLAFGGRAGIPGTRSRRHITIEYRVGRRPWKPFLRATTNAVGRYHARFHPAVPLIGRVQFRAVIGSASTHEGTVSATRAIRFST